MDRRSRATCAAALLALLVTAGCSAPSAHWGEELGDPPLLVSVDDLPDDSAATIEARPSRWNWLWAAPTNVVYWPWRAVTRTGRGFVDGVILTFDHNELPGSEPFILPFNALGGAGIGLWHSFSFDPNLITPDVAPGHAFGSTLAEPVTLIDRTPQPRTENDPRPRPASWE